MRRFVKTVLLLGCLIVGATSVDAASESQIIAGAGPSTEIVKLFFDAFAKLPEAKGTSFTVMPSSVKHAGGLKNSDLYLFGRSGRPLNEEEKSAGKEEILLGRIDIGFAGGLEVGVKTLPNGSLKDIVRGKIDNWKVVGGPDAPIILVGREASEAVFLELKSTYPWFQEPAFDKVFKKDDDVSKFLLSPDGRHALAFGVKSQLPEAQLLNVAGFNAGLKVGLIYDRKNEANEMIKAAKRFSTSNEWRKLLESKGFNSLK